ncbi:MAG: hypothetical protein WBM32_00185, partial [Crocosphaera sp.]
AGGEQEGSRRGAGGEQEGKSKVRSNITTVQFLRSRFRECCRTAISVPHESCPLPPASKR